MTRAQVRNLEERSALWVSKHLVMAGRLLDIDAEEAFQHALAASRRGGRLAAVREAVGVTAYAAGHYGEALREFRTFRRISGSNVHLPVMADCERGLGRPDRALDLARTEEAETLDAAGRAELAMVVSGARADLGQLDAAVSALELPQLDLHRAFAYSPRLFRAYADALDAVGRSAESETWRRQASVADKALGIEEDEEPDIIDLGDDDDDLPTERIRPSRAAEAVADEDIEKPEEPELFDVPALGADTEPDESVAVDDAVDAAVEADAAVDADEEIEAYSAVDANEEVGADAAKEEVEADEADDAGAQGSAGVADGADQADATAAPAAAPSSSTSRTASAPLQTEMLFSMDTPATEGGTDSEPDPELAPELGATSVVETEEPRQDRSRNDAPRHRAPAVEPPAGQDVIDE